MPNNDTPRDSRVNFSLFTWERQLMDAAAEYHGYVVLDLRKRHTIQPWLIGLGVRNAMESLPDSTVNKILERNGMRYDDELRRVVRVDVDDE